MYKTNINPNWASTNLAGYKLTLYLVKVDTWNNPDSCQ